MMTHHALQMTFDRLAVSFVDLLYHASEFLPDSISPDMDAQCTYIRAHS